MSGAGLSKLSAHRRPLATAAAAGGVLCALWFVPTANATPDRPAHPAPQHGAVTQTDHQQTDHGKAAPAGK
ncbi:MULTISPECIES: hypothetical protein [unclassified Streptomyces]|uniref:hypothetical protein n=1 Tax=unclassified Streptomyces TaxID=2593676 RepID=UPI002DDB220C|nr:MULTISPECIES: hypothetical protein [unclassified Streptomyces]WSA97535.1 hypothetical protein OIE63_15045 [Streptomyces sp. NBC_01795]WSB81960.1 hypothetical protein OHB04_15880 [Streptomyces sp. NBC_01775]WSS17931.1 hypothetical protein OG533_24095 [Streptomyces sp. NBC_01186]WSS46680.1 hypothetical protein OG220_24765 [Streptomyces sp. NBC_01187]